MARAALAWWQAQPLRLRGWLAGGVAALLALLVVGAALAGPAVPGVTLTGSRPAPGDAAGPDYSLDGDQIRDADGTPTPEPSIGSIQELVSLHGEPPGYDFGRLRIPLLAVDAPIGVSVVDGSSGTLLGSPEGPATVFWYNLDAWPGLGGVPGAGGNAIFGGHVDISSYLPYADATYHGPGVFRDLNQLVPGDRIFIDRAGASLEYVVEWTEQIDAGASNRWGDIWSANVAVDSITLYTCGGDFDFNTASYADRYVVRATAVGG